MAVASWTKRLKHFASRKWKIFFFPSTPQKKCFRKLLSLFFSFVFFSLENRRTFSHQPADEKETLLSPVQKNKISLFFFFNYYLCPWKWNQKVSSSKTDIKKKENNTLTHTHSHIERERKRRFFWLSIVSASFAVRSFFRSFGSPEAYCHKMSRCV